MRPSLCSLASGVEGGGRRDKGGGFKASARKGARESCLLISLAIQCRSRNPQPPSPYTRYTLSCMCPGPSPQPPRLSPLSIFTLPPTCCPDLGTPDAAPGNGRNGCNGQRYIRQDRLHFRASRASVAEAHAKDTDKVLPCPHPPLTYTHAGRGGRWGGEGGGTRIGGQEGRRQQGVAYRPPARVALQARTLAWAARHAWHAWHCNLIPAQST